MNFYNVNDVDQDEWTSKSEMLVGMDKFPKKEVEDFVSSFIPQIVQFHIDAFFKLKPKKKSP